MLYAKTLFSSNPMDGKLTSLKDVQIIGLQDGQYLTWDESLGKWVNTDPTSVSLIPLLITTDHLLTSNDYMIYVSASSNNVNITLPAMGEFKVKRIDASDYIVSIIPVTSIDGETSKEIKYKNTCLDLVGYNNVWKIT